MAVEISVPSTLVAGTHDPQAAVVDLVEAAAQLPGGLSGTTDLLEQLAARRQSVARIAEAVAAQPVPVGVATAGQVALVDERWRRIEERYGVVDAGGYAVLVGAARTSRSVASKARAKGLVGYRRGRRILYPRFQFDRRGLRPGWSEVVQPLRDSGWDDEDIVLWLAAPHGRLGRRSPVVALDDGDRDAVLSVIHDAGAGVW